MKKWWIEAFAFLAIAVGIYFILRKVNLGDIFSVVSSANPLFLILAFLVFFLSYVFWNLRIMTALKDYVKGNFWFFLLVLLSGSFLNTITPGARIGGEPLRAHFIGRKYKKPRTKILACLVSDKIFHIFVFGIFLVFSLFYMIFFAHLKPEMGAFFWIIAITAIIFISAFLYITFSKSRTDLRWLLVHVYKIKFVKDKFASCEDFCSYFVKKRRQFFSSLKYFVSHKETFFAKILYSLLYWLSLFFASYFLFLAFGFKVKILPLIAVLSIANAFGEISPTPGGVGVFEGSMLLLFASFKIPLVMAAIVSFSTGIISYFYALVFGGISFLYLRFKEGY